MAHSHKRDTNARRTPTAAKIAAPVAVFATLASVTVGVLLADPTPEMVNANQASFTKLTRDDDTALSRDTDRLALARAAAREARERAATQKAIKNADQRLWTTAPLNLWDSADKKARLLGEIDAGKRVLVTGRRDNGRAEIVLKGKARWVTQEYLSREKPEFGPTLGGDCTNGTSVPSGVSPYIAKIHEAVCANFPEISTYGTFRGGGGDHSLGKAVDIMVSGDRGWEVAEFIRANASFFGVNYIIYAQQIWSVDRGAEGWRGMEDRGSITANHYDHVHVSVY